MANFGWIRGGQYDKVTEDLKKCVEAAHKYGREIKVIFETDALNEEQIRKTCHCCIEAGDKCKVKGSGCIRTREHFLQLIDMGIDRMGVGYRSVPVVLECK